MRDVYALPSRVIDLGRLGENQHSVVIFDVSSYLAQYPGATFTLLNQRPGDTTAYPVAAVELIGDDLKWTVASSDLTKTGSGRCELLVMQGETVAKSIIYVTRVGEALDGSGTAPEPWASWQTVFGGLKDDAEAAAADAQAASQAVQDMGVTATTLAAGSDATVTKTVDQSGAVTLAFGIPQGAPGEVSQSDLDALWQYVRDMSPTVEVTGTVANATYAAPLDADEVTIKITPAQAGSGDPSLDNIRPITGWTGARLSHSGQNTSSPTTLDISWQAKAGTVYGGALNITNGVLTVDRIKFTASAVREVSLHSSGYYYWVIAYTPMSMNATSGLISDQYVNSGNVAPGHFYIKDSGRSLVVVPYSGQQSITTKEDATAWMTSHPADFIIPVAVPMIYYLTSHQITMLRGTNNIWADTGNTTLRYRQDVALLLRSLIGGGN